MFKKKEHRMWEKNLLEITTSTVEYSFLTEITIFGNIHINDKIILQGFSSS